MRFTLNNMHRLIIAGALALALADRGLLGGPRAHEHARKPPAHEHAGRCLRNR